MITKEFFCYYIFYFIHNNIGGFMNDSFRYNLFILISTIGRNLVEVFSLVFLYKMGYDIKSILLFLFVMYSSGIISNSLGLYLASKIGYKYVLIISSLLFGFSYYYLSVMNTTTINLILLGILMSFGNYMYHVVRHYVAMMIKGINVSNILIWNYIGIMFTSLVGAYITDKLSLLTNVIIVIVLSLISLIPIIKIKDHNRVIMKLSKVKLGKKKYFFIMEQFKVIFCELQGLFLYLYIEENLIYIGLFQLFIGIASILFLFYFNKLKGNRKFFKYLNILLCIVLLFKINVGNKYILYVVALMEGLFLKEFEYFSTLNLYDREDNNIYGYLMVVEIIFSVSKSIMVLLFYLFLDSLYWIMIICIVGIFLCSFLYPRRSGEIV